MIIIIINLVFVGFPTKTNYSDTCWKLINVTANSECRGLKSGVHFHLVLTRGSLYGSETKRYYN